MNSAVSPDNLEFWIHEVFRLNEEYYKLIGTEPDQVLHPPASESQIAELEAYLSIRLPPSYRMFLSLHDGWRSWEGEEHLLSTGQFLAPEFREHFRLVKEVAWDQGQQRLLEGVIIGACLSSPALLFLDTSRVDEDGEMEIVNWEHKEVARYSDFIDLLQNTAVDLRQIIEDEKAAQSAN